MEGCVALSLLHPGAQGLVTEAVGGADRRHPSLPKARNRIPESKAAGTQIPVPPRVRPSQCGEDDPQMACEHVERCPTSPGRQDTAAHPREGRRPRLTAPDAGERGAAGAPLTVDGYRGCGRPEDKPARPFLTK